MDLMDGQGLGKNVIGKLVRKVFGEEVCEQISLNGQRMCPDMVPFPGVTSQ